MKKILVVLLAVARVGFAVACKSTGDLDTAGASDWDGGRDCDTGGGGCEGGGGVAIHPRQLDVRLKVGDGPHAAQNPLGTDFAGHIGQQMVEPHHLTTRVTANNLMSEGDPFVDIQ